MPVGERALSVGLEKKMQTQLLVTTYYAIYVRSVFDRFDQVQNVAEQWNLLDREP